MSDDEQPFAGALTYADAHGLEVGLDAFEAIDGRAIHIRQFTRHGDTLSIDGRTHRPVPLAATLRAIRALAAPAVGGAIDADGTKIRAGKKRTPKTPPHHRWDVYFAARTGDAKTLRLLAKRDIELALTFDDHANCSPMHLAAEAESIPAITALVDAGVPIDPHDQWKRTPLFYAKKPATVRALIDAGADANHAYLGNTPLMQAIQAGDESLARAHLDAGATLRKGKHKEAAAFCARHRMLALLRELVDAWKLRKHLAHQDVMHNAIMGGDAVIVDYLLEHGARMPKDLIVRAVASSAHDLVVAALRDPDAIELCGDSTDANDLMCRAAAGADLRTMKLLAGAGVPVSATALARANASSFPTTRECVAWLERHLERSR